MMREVMARRFARAQEEDPDRDGGMWPDLVLIDGGKGQMSSVQAMRWRNWGSRMCRWSPSPRGRTMGAKGAKCSTSLMGAKRCCRPIRRVLFYLQRLRDEVHRFAIGAHRAKRSRAISASPAR